MKNKKRFIYFSAVIMTCILGITCLSSCQNDDEENVDIVKAIIVEVDSTPCIVNIEWPEPYSITGMSIKEENSSEWQKVPLTRINGFTYEPGYYYTLKVKKVIPANPPADGSSRNYILIEVLKKEKDSSSKED